MELVRAFRGTRPGFTVSTCGFVSVQNALIGASLVDLLVAAFAGENYPNPRPSRVVQRAIASGRLDMENWSMWSLVARLMAGALDIPFMPVKSIVDSSMEENLEATGFGFASADFGAETLHTGVVRSLRPDITLVHAVAADQYGNTVLAAPCGEGQ